MIILIAEFCPSNIYSFIFYLCINYSMNSKHSAIYFLIIIAIIIPAAVTDDPILASDYVNQIGKGFDVTWSEFGKYMEAYNSNVPAFFAAEGFKNVRIRMNQPNPDKVFMDRLKGQVTDCINNGIYPILSYQGHSLEESTDHEQNKIHLKEWWGKMAVHFKDYSYKLSFNILVEISGTYKTDYENINNFYVAVLRKIRKHDPNRVVIFPPVKISSPDYLQYLQIPGGSEDLYTMAEWHFYAAGPNPSESSKKYWVDGKTVAERQNVLGPIETAHNWSTSTGYKTWVGAWMPGNYNKGHNFDLTQQVRFGSFLVRSLDAKNIPWSVNAGNKFYDYENNKWFTTTTDAGGIAVVHAMLDPNKISLYTGTSYEGSYLRLGTGYYDKADLDAAGFTGAKSIMIPIDFRVTFYSEAGYQGDRQILTVSGQTIHSTEINSLEVEYIPFPI